MENIITFGIIAILTLLIGIIVMAFGKGETIKTIAVEIIITVVLFAVGGLAGSNIKEMIPNFNIIITVELGIVLFGTILNTIALMTRKCR